MWTAVSYVSSGLTLLAFVTAVIAWTYRNRILHERKLIEAAPEEDRRSLVLATLEFFDVDTRNLTKQQQYQIAIQQIRHRANRFLISAILVAALAILGAIVAIYSMTQNSPKASFSIIDSDTSEPIHREVAVTYRLRDGEHSRPARGSGGYCTIEGIKESQIEIENASCAGYDYVGIEKGAPTKILFSRNDEFLRQIIPGDPLWQGQMPTDDEYTFMVQDEVPASEVILTCRNKTPRFVDVLLFHYVPGRPNEFGLGWTPVCLCSPNGVDTFAAFGQTPGYFLVFLSSYGMPARYAAQGHFYRTKQPKLTLYLDEKGEIDGKIN